MSLERDLLGRWHNGDLLPEEYMKLMKEAKELLAQPEQTEQEPVAWQFRTFHGEYTACPGWDVWEDCTEPKFNNVSELITKGFYQVRKLYTAPPKRKPLTSKLISLGNNCHESFIKGVRFAEKMHGITGVDDE